MRGQWGERAMRLLRLHNMSDLDTEGLTQQGYESAAEVHHCVKVNNSYREGVGGQGHRFV